MAPWETAGQREGGQASAIPTLSSGFQEESDFGLSSFWQQLHQEAQRHSIQRKALQTANSGSVEDVGNRVRNPSTFRSGLRRRPSSVESVAAIIMPYGAHRHQAQTHLELTKERTKTQHLKSSGAGQTVPHLHSGLPNSPWCVRRDMFLTPPHTTPKSQHCKTHLFRKDIWRLFESNKRFRFKTHRDKYQKLLRVC